MSIPPEIYESMRRQFFAQFGHGLELAEMVPKHLVLVALILAGALFVWRKPAATQHRYWLLGFVWLAVLPLLVCLEPQMPLSISRPVHTGSPMLESVPAVSASALPRADIPSVSAQAPEPQVSPAASARQIYRPTPIERSPFSNLAEPALGFALGVYLLGLIVSLLRIGMSLLAVRRLARGTELPATPELISAAKAVGLKRVPRLILNPWVPVPVTFRAGGHVIVVPSDEVSSAVLLHECAHIRRGDWNAQVFCCLVRAVYWFDPILWSIERRMRSLSETAADDCVISAGVEAPGYAEELTAIASHLGGRRMSGGVAIVGAGNLKARIQELLRPGPRWTRVRTRWMVGAGIGGACTAIACAALRYSAVFIPIVDDGLVTLPDRSWVKLVAITDVSGDHPISWDIHGNLLPRAVGPEDWLRPDQQPAIFGPAPRQCLVFATNMNDSDGFGVQSPGVKFTLPNVIQGGVWGYHPQSISGDMLWAVPVSFSGSGTSSFTLSLPSQSTWTVLGTADYKDGRLISTSQAGMFPNTPSDGKSHYISIPKGVQGRVELQDYYENMPSGPLAEMVDAAGGSMMVFEPPAQRKDIGPFTKLVLRCRPAPVQVYLDGIPTKPRSNAVLTAEAPDGIEYETAHNGNFEFRDGQVLSLKSVSDDTRTWLPSGGTAPTDKLAHRAWHDSNGGFEPTFWAANSFADRLPGDSCDVLHFQISPRIQTTTSPEISLYDADGLSVCTGWTTSRDSSGFQTLFFLPASRSSQPQDFVVRITDSQNTVRMSGLARLKQAFSTYKFTPTKADWDDKKSLVKLEATLAKSLSGHNPLSEAEELVFLDSMQQVVPCTPARDIPHARQEYPDSVYLFSPADASRVAYVQVRDIPYIYVRFPNVAVNPK